MNKRMLICLFFLPFSIALKAQKVVTLSGRVNGRNDKSVQGASVSLLNTHEGKVTDADGKFSIPQLPAGNYTLRISAIGYASLDTSISLAQDASVDVLLTDAASQLDEVIITAQKKEELPQKVPIAITVLSAKEVQDYRLWNIKDIAGISPNLYSANPGDNRNVTSIRGIATTSYDPAVATYIDGVNQFGLDTYFAELLDVERIEVLRGPQGTLYGRNAMAGVINIITRQPTNKTTGFAEISMGNYGQQRYSAGIKTALVKDKLYFGASGLYDAMNGFYTNDLIIRISTSNTAIQETIS
jgi:iron complex outermembrane receptor protein